MRNRKVNTSAFSSRKRTRIIVLLKVKTYEYFIHSTCETVISYSFYQTLRITRLINSSWRRSGKLSPVSHLCAAVALTPSMAPNAFSVNSQEALRRDISFGAMRWRDEGFKTRCGVPPLWLQHSQWILPSAPISSFPVVCGLLI